MAYSLQGYRVGHDLTAKPQLVMACKKQKSIVSHKRAQTHTLLGLAGETSSSRESNAHISSLMVIAAPLKWVRVVVGSL